MAKSLIRNQLAGRTFGFALPADGATAKTFCDNHLEGTYSVYEVEATQGNEVEAKVLRVTVTGKSAAGRKHTITFYGKAGLKESEIRTALQDVTFNNVKFDEVFVINISEIDIA
ncbi:hypothetical protein [Campylobacter sp. RM16187]|uniref:hypothetical protein n=1 Tax=Campylobacter sp. RM16187 TaxID=1660063 RepID=UPI0021B51E5C|nr:hypothetical protein [Campylobacter sp. RM16187]QKG28765.1 hypothetical protein CDOMF_0483 [Campylobacter sp. RM16187]